MIPVKPEALPAMVICAGANLCANMATSWDKPLLADHFGAAPECFKPMAVVLGYPLTDYSYQEEYNATLPPILCFWQATTPFSEHRLPKKNSWMR